MVVRDREEFAVRVAGMIHETSRRSQALAIHNVEVIIIVVVIA
jgi:hypothetical protein